MAKKKPQINAPVHATYEVVRPETIRLTSHAEYFRSISFDGRQLELPKEGFVALRVDNIGEHTAEMVLREDLTAMDSIFHDCGHLTALSPAFFKGCGKLRSLSNAFARCTRLKELPPDLLEYTPLLEDLSYAFFKCICLEAIPPFLLRSVPELERAAYMFAHCRGVKELPEWPFRTNYKLRDLAFAFSYMFRLRKLPDGILSGLSNVQTTKGMFFDCRNLNAVCDFQFHGSDAIRDASLMFAKCYSIDLNKDALKGRFPEKVDMSNMTMGTIQPELEYGLNQG